MYSSKTENDYDSNELIECFVFKILEIKFNNLKYFLYTVHFFVYIIIKIDIYENNQEIRKMIIFDFIKIDFIKLLKYKNNFLIIKLR